MTLINQLKTFCKPDLITDLEKWYHFENLKTTAPEETDLKVGDHVIFTNDYGVEFKNRVIGFATNDLYVKYGNKKFVYLEKDSFWMPVSVNQLKKVK